MISSGVCFPQSTLWMSKGIVGRFDFVLLLNFVALRRRVSLGPRLIRFQRSGITSSAFNSPLGLKYFVYHQTPLLPSLLSQLIFQIFSLRESNPF